MIKKHLIVLLGVLSASFSSYSQQTINASITHGGIQRDYILYVPANYTGTTAVPLILNFHGYTSNANDQMWYGDFRAIADTAGFLIVHPQGTLYQGNTHWNVTGLYPGSTVDDLGFTSSLIDSISANYNINASRIYSTGMSNGGYMSFYLACQLSNKIAAIASVTGSMTPTMTNACNPQHSTPALKIHGTSDATVPYNGNTWTNSIINVAQYWANYNNSTITPTITNLPDINLLDNSTVEHYLYPNGNNGSTVEHFKVIGGGHTWPGNIIGGTGTNYDINASAEIWRFFSKYDINGLTTSAEIPQLTENTFSIHPNPTNSFILIEGDFTSVKQYEILSIQGKKLHSGLISENNKKINLETLAPNLYFLKVENSVYKILKTP